MGRMQGIAVAGVIETSSSLAKSQKSLLYRVRPTNLHYPEFPPLRFPWNPGWELALRRPTQSLMAYVKACLMVLAGMNQKGSKVPLGLKECRE